MKTVLDLIAEFANLNDAKVTCGGKLPAEDERRWEELKGFYDLLMSHPGMSPNPLSRRFSATEVLSKVRSRERLRVPLETEMLFKVGGEYHAGFAMNVSRGGVFLSSAHLIPASSPVTVFLATPDSADQALVETDGIVAWVANHGVQSALLPPGMGIRFVNKEGLIERYLDAMVIDALVRHLSGLDADSLAPELILAEQVEL